MKQHPTLHKIADDHFGKITGALAGVAGACAIGYFARKAYIRRYLSANAHERKNVIESLYEQAVNNLCSKLMSPHGDVVTASATYVQHSGLLVEVSTAIHPHQPDQGTITVQDYITSSTGRTRTYTTDFNPFSTLQFPMKSQNTYIADPFGIKHALASHAFEHPESTGGTFSQPLPVYNGYTPRYTDSSQNSQYNPYTGEASNKRVIVMDSPSNAFSWRAKPWSLSLQKFSALFHWATYHYNFEDGLHTILIEDKANKWTDHYRFQVASVNKTTETNELGPIFSYQFTVNNQQKTFSVSGYQNEEAFTNDWRYVWQMIDTMSPEELRGELIIITKDAVDQHHKRGQYSSKSQHGRSQAASSVPEPISIGIESSQLS
jgi:hypothetical protein